MRYGNIWREKKDIIFHVQQQKKWFGGKKKRRFDYVIHGVPKRSPTRVDVLYIPVGLTGFEPATP